MSWLCTMVDWCWKSDPWDLALMSWLLPWISHEVRPQRRVWRKARVRRNSCGMWGFSGSRGEQSSPNLERNTRVTGNFQGIGIHLLIRNADSKRSASPKLSHSMSFVYRFYSGFAFNPLDLPEKIPEEHNFERNEFRHWGILGGSKNLSKVIWAMVKTCLIFPWVKVDGRPSINPRPLSLNPSICSPKVNRSSRESGFQWGAFNSGVKTNSTIYHYNII